MTPDERTTLEEYADGNTYEEVRTAIRSALAEVDRWRNERDLWAASCKKAEADAAEWKAEAEEQEANYRSQWRERVAAEKELRAEVALWKKATGKDDAEALDSYLGRAGIDHHIDVLNGMRLTAEAERDEWRAKAFHPSGQKWEHVLSGLASERDHYRERAASNAQQAKDERHLKAEAEKERASARAQALEEAARVAERIAEERCGNYSGYDAGMEIARDIRALAPPRECPECTATDGHKLSCSAHGPKALVLPVDKETTADACPAPGGVVCFVGGRTPCRVHGCTWNTCECPISEVP